MFVISQASSTLATALASFQELLPRVVLLRARADRPRPLIARGLAALIRSRIDVVSLGMGWPAPVRLLLRVFIANIGIAIFAVLAWATRISMAELIWASRGYPVAVAASLATAWLS